jgi:hypothetical protein
LIKSQIIQIYKIQLLKHLLPPYYLSTHYLLIETAMNNLVKITAALGTMIIMTGCSVRTPAGSVVVDPNRTSVVIGDGGNGGNFCPPGQAKKGRC